MEGIGQQVQTLSKGRIAHCTLYSLVAHGVFFRGDVTFTRPGVVCFHRSTHAMTDNSTEEAAVIS
jgi:hypothetical protein